MILNIILILLSIGGSIGISLPLSINYSYWFLLLNIALAPILYFLLFALYLIFLIIWGAFFNKKKEGKVSKFYYHILRQVDWVVCLIARAKIRFVGKEKLPKKPYLLITNHISNFDQMIIIKAIGNQKVICVTKPENFNFPIAGPFIHHSGFIPINREDPREGLKAIKKASDVIKNNEGLVCIAPEGTRNKTNELLLPFHAGSFKIAYYAQSDIAIGVLHNTKKIKSNFPWKRTNVEFKILDVLKYEDFKDKTTQDIANYAYNLIYQDLKRELEN